MSETPKAASEVEVIREKIADLATRIQFDLSQGGNPSLLVAKRDELAKRLDGATPPAPSKPS